MSESGNRPSQWTRREFVHSAAVAGAGLLATSGGFAQDADGKKPADTKPAGATQPASSAPAENAAEVAVALIGAGSQGRNLLNNCLKIPGIRFIAVCDIWPYHQKYAANILKKYDQPVNVYADYRELLDKEKNLVAAIVATPDWMHAEQSIACLKAGRHVYCEKEMSNTLDGARQMVLAARETKKLLQIGHQRRSNPRYQHAIKLIENDKVLGRITTVNGQWNRARLEEQGWPKGEELDADALKRFGYETMDRFRNWRWYRQYSGGAIADLGSHQIDVFNWILKATPKSVLAAGGLDYYKKEGREWYDNVMAIFEYELTSGPVRAFYQVLNTSSYGGFWEAFMGDEGAIVVSEDSRVGQLYREVHAKKREWENESEKIEAMGREAIELKIGETLDPSGKRTAEGEKLMAEAKKPVHQLHLENFFGAIRNGTPLSCPPEVGYGTAVSVLKVNDAVEAGKRIEYKPEEFFIKSA
ncbi:MAG: Gfo/Idh/MocA family oxidoreductase [Phycisphaerae bacterium]